LIVVGEKTLHAGHGDEIGGSRKHLSLLLVVHHFKHVAESVEVIEANRNLIDANRGNFFDRSIQILFVVAGCLQWL
jgi:hypothetical protein